MRGLGRQQVAAFVAEQRAAHAVLERMERPVHAHRADIERLSGLGKVAGLHEGQQGLELAERDLFTDAQGHGGGGDERVSGSGTAP
ncbi:hypothetical protein D3C81_1825290 [compost metagenome]